LAYLQTGGVFNHSCWRLIVILERLLGVGRKGCYLVRASGTDCDFTGSEMVLALVNDEEKH